MKKRSIFPVATALVLLHSAAFGQETERLKEQAAGAAAATKEAARQAVDVVEKSAREAWAKTKAYFSDEPETYSRGADQRLKELGAEIATLRANAAQFKDRAYFLTRIDALDQHHKFATDQFAALPAEELRKGREGLRKNLDVVISRLDDYVDLAQKEAAEFRP